MEYSSPCDSILSSEEEDMRRGPWTVEEDHLLVNYVTAHGEGRWNSLARSAGLKRSGKSCRLRWLNYLRPNVRRGSITPEEQLLILELHSRWGNRWSKIAQHLPGRTDNEIKNYWRTRVQKHAKQLRCDVNSKQFKDLMRYIWMPRLIERIHSSNSNNTNNSAQEEVIIPQNMHQNNLTAPTSIMITNNSSDNSSITSCGDSSWASSEKEEFMHFSSPPPLLMCESFSSSAGNMQSMQVTEQHVRSWIQEISDDEQQLINKCWLESLPSPATGLASSFGLNNFEPSGNLGDNLWASDDWLQNLLDF